MVPTKQCFHPDKHLQIVALGSYVYERNPAKYEDCIQL